jgi:TetR/AcrR family transcriptional regulator, transcriptional repressor for nem operon
MALTRSRREANTAERILDVAERLVQVRGFNGFSYADVATELQITKASLHYHFPGKAALGEALIARYAARFTDALANIDARLPDARHKLDAYGSLYTEVLRKKRMCMCGILAAEYQTLPTPMREAVTRFFDDNEAWLTGVLAQGLADGILSFDGSPSDAAQMIVSGLEGAMLIARTHGGLTRFQSTASRLLDSFTS